MRFLGLDVGERRIGVAVSDELGWTAQPLTVVDNSDPEGGLDAIVDLVEQYAPVAVVVGLPRRTDGVFGPEADAVRAFGALIAQRIDVPVLYQDERFSTAEAERRLIASGVRRARRRQVVDKVAAGIILQSYLDRRRHTTEDEE